MERNGEGAPAASSSSSSSSSQITRPRRSVDPLLVTCRFFSVITALTAILCIVSNVISAIRSFKNQSDIFDGIFRCYAVVIAFFVVLAETEWEFIFKNWKIGETYDAHLHFTSVVLHAFIAINTKYARLFYTQIYPEGAFAVVVQVLEYWAGRGMLQIFVAVMTRAFPVYSVEQRELILLQDAASYLLLACGAVYVVSGILCIGFLKRAREKKETAKDKVVKDLQELERQKQELQQLLISETV